MILVMTGALAAGGWYVWCSIGSRPSPVSSAQPVSRPAVTRVTSGRGGFSIVLPDGWRPVLRLLDSDRFLVMGTGQPPVRAGQAATVRNTASFDGGSGPAVFDAAIGDGFAPPQGEATDFVFGSGRNLLSGTKYVHSYAQDGPDNGGYQRLRGDSDYTYVFALGGSRELRVVYRVYAADPRDQVQAVEAAVRSIRLLR